MNLEQKKLYHWKRYRTLERKAKEEGINEEEAKDVIAYRTLHGGGFFDSIKSKVKDFFSTRKDFSDADKKTFAENKDKRIKKMMIVRTPLSWFSKTFADIVSLGTFSEQTQRLGYDRVYHLYSLIYLEGIEQPIMYEKNETVVLRFGSPSTDQYTQMKEVQNIPVDMTLGKFVQTAQNFMGEEEYWHYTFERQNCQRFLMLNLKANNLLTPDLQNFIMQDAEKLLSQAPSISRKFAQGIADTSAFLRKLTGRGLNEQMEV